VLRSTVSSIITSSVLPDIREPVPAFPKYLLFETTESVQLHKNGQFVFSPANYLHEKRPRLSTLYWSSALKPLSPLIRWSLHPEALFYRYWKMKLISKSIKYEGVRCDYTDNSGPSVSDTLQTGARPGNNTVVQ